MLVKYSPLKAFLFLLNYLAFYFIWIGCLYAAVHGLSLYAVSSVGVYLFIHLFYLCKQPIAELFLITAIILFGTVNDMLLTTTGILKYVDASNLGASWWMTGIWGCFGSTYWHAFSWLDSQKLLTAGLGAIIVPLCYLWGVKAYVVNFLVSHTIALSIIGFLWGGLLPLTFAVSRSIKKFRR